MATGDVPDMLARTRATLPEGWFPDEAPNLDAVLAGPSLTLARLWSLLQGVYGQGRLATASGSRLEVYASDFLGVGFTRLAGESDAVFRVRIRRTILAPKATRAAVVAAVADLTGNVPVIVEPANASDCGGYGARSGRGGGGLGYGVAGAYGSRLLPFQAFLTVARPINPGIPLVAGYGTGAAGYGSRATPGAAVGASEYASLAMRPGVQDADILAAIASTQPAATVIWTRITDPVVAPGANLDSDFILDRSTLG